VKFSYASALVFVFGCHFLAHAKPSVITQTEGSCEMGLDPKWFKRDFHIDVPNWANDLSMIQGSLEAAAWGPVRTFFSKEWDTQVYYAGTGKVDRETMEVPLVDPDSKAVVLFFHGSGTAKSSGANFVSNISTLAKWGYSAVSFDMPKHASGSLRERMSDSKYFMNYVKNILEDVKSFGKPVFLAGHSFGPEVMFELMTRYPNLVAGGLAMSPAGYNKVLSEWYRTHTSRMKFGGAVAENSTGGEWASAVTQGFVWNKHALPDPTEVNPNLKLRILVGDREEYVPAPVGGSNRTPTGPNTYNVEPVLRGFFKNAVITMEKGIGHYLFDFKGQDGIPVVERELLLTLGEKPDSGAELTKMTGRQRSDWSNSEKLMHRLKSDYLFQAWSIAKRNKDLIETIFKTEDNKRAHFLLQEFTDDLRDRMVAINQTIAKTKETDPEFYQKNQTAIENAVKKRVFDDGLLGLYYVRERGASVTIN
jgi:pimeloyl-ACP methyl ester carboxylesterase